jgi:hypothetical protein
MTQIVAGGVCAQPGNHFVQFYDAEPDALVANVAGFIDEGLQQGDSVIVIATPEHSEAFISALGSSRAQRDLRSRRLILLDAAATLEQFMVAGEPNWYRFENVIGATIRGLRRAKPASALRAYGEMVGLLWAAGRLDAAVKLEKYWNVLLGGDAFSLFCSYPIDVGAEGYPAAHVHDVLGAHTHFVSG